MNPSTDLPSASIVIATFNRTAILASTIACLAKQTVDPLEVIVVDQSLSPDGTPQDNSAELKRPVLRYFFGHPPNAQKARNFGIREARGEIVILVDDDMELPSCFVEAHVRNYLPGSTWDGVSGQVLKPREQATTEIPRYVEHRPEGWMFFPLNYALRTNTINWPSCNASVRKSAAIAAGGFDEHFTRTLYDDTDFSKRLWDSGAEIVFDPEATAVHLKAQSGGRRPGALNSWVPADRENWATVFYFWRKNFGMWVARRMFAKRFCANLLRKNLLLHPVQFGVALRELIAGWNLSSCKLEEGPRYAWTPVVLPGRGGWINPPRVWKTPETPG